MSQKRIPVRLFMFTTYVLLHATVQSDCFQLTRNIESEKNDFNLKLSAAVNFILKSVKSTVTVRVVACGRCYQNDFNDIMERWQATVSVTLLNMEREYQPEEVIEKNDFILMLLDERFASYLEEYMKNMMGRIRKHKVLVVLRTNGCDNTNG